MDSGTQLGAQTDGGGGHAVEEFEEDEDGDMLDPRIQVELDRLNQATSDINRLENELDEARNKYRSTVSEISQRMEPIAHDRKRSIQKSREYYKLVEEAKQAKGEAQKAVRAFQGSIMQYQAAKETLALAEKRLTEEASNAAAQLTSAWQEMLNHAVSKVMEAEREKTIKENEHKAKAAVCTVIEERMKVLEKSNPRCIKRAKVYFDLKADLDIKLLQQKQNVTDLQEAIKASKKKYKLSLRKLESISEEIHQTRRDKLWSKIPRMPCVGAETDSLSSATSELYTIDDIDLQCNKGSSQFGSETDSVSIKSESVGESVSINPTDQDSRLRETTRDGEDTSDKGDNKGEAVDQLKKGDNSSAIIKQDDDEDDVFYECDSPKETQSDSEEKCNSDNSNIMSSRADNASGGLKPSEVSLVPLSDGNTEDVVTVTPRKDEVIGDGMEFQRDLRLNEMAFVERPSLSGAED